MKCPHCDYEPRTPDADWGYLNGPKWSDYCQHVHAMRECGSCSERWWKVGLTDEWDIDGCAREVCPECAAEGITLDQCRRPPAREDGEEWRGREREEYDREQQARIQAWR